MATKKRAKQPSVQPKTPGRRYNRAKDAIALLKADHRKVEGFFNAFEAATSSAEKQSLAKRICNALKVHTQIEEQIFYPAFIAATGEQELHDEALVEHQGAKRLIAEIEADAPGAPLFDAKVSVLAEMIKHHVKEEEGFGGMFAKAKRSKMDLAELGAELAARKQRIARAPSSKRTTPPGRSGQPFTMGAAALARSRGSRQPPRRVP